MTDSASISLVRLCKIASVYIAIVYSTSIDAFQEILHTTEINIHEIPLYLVMRMAVYQRLLVSFRSFLFPENLAICLASGNSGESCREFLIS